MVAITDYNSLVQAIQEVSEDEGSEFIMYIPTAIDLAEERLYKEFDLPDVELRDTGNVVVGNMTITKPAGYTFPISLKVKVSGIYYTLKHRMSDFIEDYWPDETKRGVPKYYSDGTLSTLRIAPIPDVAYDYVLKYSAKPAKLSTSNLTNYYTDNLKDSLFFATMSEMSVFMKAWSQVDSWEKKLSEARDGWNLMMQRKRRDAGEIPYNTAGGPNSLVRAAKSES